MTPKDLKVSESTGTNRRGQAVLGLKCRRCGYTHMTAYGPIPGEVPSGSWWPGYTTRTQAYSYLQSRLTTHVCKPRWWRLLLRLGR